MEDDTEWATIGTIVAPFGIRGEVKVYLSTDMPERFSAHKKIYLGREHAPRTVEAVRSYKGNMLLLKLSGVDDATAAEPLRRCDLYIPVSDLPQLPPDSYYQHDILGLRVLTLDEREVGTVIEILPTGSNDVYVVEAANKQQFLIPAIKDVVKQIDLNRQVMYIHPMKGLLNDDEAAVDTQTEEGET